MTWLGLLTLPNKLNFKGMHTDSGTYSNMVIHSILWLFNTKVQWLWVMILFHSILWLFNTKVQWLWVMILLIIN